MSHTAHSFLDSTAKELQVVHGEYGLLENKGSCNVPHRQITEAKDNSTVAGVLHRSTAGSPHSPRSELFDLLGASQDDKKQSCSTNARHSLDYDPDAEPPQSFTPAFFRLTSTHAKSPVLLTRASSGTKDRLTPERPAIPNLPAFLAEQVYDQAYYQLSTSEKLEVIRLLVRYCPVELSGGKCERRHRHSSPCKLRGVCNVSVPTKA